MINKKELRYIILAALFAFVVFGLIIPTLVSSGIESSNPYFQFIIFNICIFIFLQLFLKSITLGGSLKISGAIGIIALFMAIDILMPPLLISYQGELLNNATLSASATDYIFGYFYNSLGITGIATYLFVYIFTPVILLLIAAKLIPNFVRHI